MNYLHWNQLEKLSVRLRHVFIKNALVVWIGLILIASLYSGQNDGGNWLHLSFNIVVWAVVCLFVVVTLAKVIYCQGLVTSKIAFYFFIMLLAILAVGSFSANIKLDGWWQMVFGFLVLSLFFWSLFQYPFTQRHLVKLLIVLCAVGFMQALIGIIQSHDTYRVAYTLVPHEAFWLSGYRPLGNFQQVNMLATFLALVLVSSLYLILSRTFLVASRVFKIWLFLVILSSFYVLLLSGSRAGLLAFLVGGGCMLVARYSFVRRHRVLFLCWLLTLSQAFVLSVYFPGLSGGLDLVVNKMAGITGGARVSLYQYSIEMFMLTPFVGLGIGNFTEPFADYIRARKNTALMAFHFIHPHNEWLYWMLQSGMVALFSPLFFVLFYLFILFKQRYTYALMVLALAMPFLIQSQLSYPFTLSSIHLFLLVFFLYVGVRFFHKKRTFILSKSVKKVLLVVTLSLIPVVLYATWHTLKSIQEIYVFDNSLSYTQFQTKEEIANQRYLETATDNILYREKVVKAMNGMVNKAIKTNNQYDLNQFVWWAEDRGGDISQQSLENLAKVYLVQGKSNQIEEVAVQLLNTYGVIVNMFDLQKEIDEIKAKKTEADLK